MCRRAFNKTIILLGLAGYETIITNSVLRTSLVIYIISYPARTRRIIVNYFFLSARAGGIQQILQSDWFRERAEFSHPARSRRAES